MKRALVALAETVAIVLKGRWRNGWVAESRMAIDIRSQALCHVAAGGIESIMESALGYFSKCRRWWRHVYINGLRMRTARNGQGKRQYSKSKGRTHGVPLKFLI